MFDFVWVIPLICDVFKLLTQTWRAGVERTLLETVKRRKISYLARIMRGKKYELLRLIIQGKIEGRKGRGRGKISWLNNIRKWTRVKSAGDLMRAAEGARDQNTDNIYV